MYAQLSSQFEFHLDRTSLKRVLYKELHAFLRITRLKRTLSQTKD
jgi:hypothetical protein